MKTTHYSPAAIYVVLASTLTLGCEDSRIPAQLTGPTTGTLEVVVATTGRTIDLDTDGYSVRVDAVSRGKVGINSTVAFGDLPTGTHVVQIDGLAPNCSFVGPNEHSMNVTGGGTTVAAFDIACALTFTQFAGDIAYVQGADSDAEIYVIKSGAEPIWEEEILPRFMRLTTQPGWDGDPSWSPDGVRIAFASDRDGNREIYVMDADGANPVRLTSNARRDYRPAWSPDGTRIAFVSERDGNDEIYAMNPDGSDLRRLTNDGDNQNSPDWSPDGTRLAFEQSGMIGPGTGIWTMKADGSDLRQLTANIREDYQPAWSPDGTKIAFVRTAYYTTDLYVVRADGDGLSQLTRGISSVSDPSWSPDGLTVAFGVDLPNGCWSRDGNPCERFIQIVRTDGTVSSLPVGVPSYNPAWQR